VLWDGAAAADLFGHLKKDQPFIKPTPAAVAGATPAVKPTKGLTVPPDQITVRVLNGVGTPGVARQSANDLKKAGFNPVVVSGTARTTGMKTTLIQYGPGRQDSAATLAAAIPGSRIKKVPSLGNTVQVLVGGNWTGVKKVKVTPVGGVQQPTARTATQNVLCK
jgi:hypothetical protein